MKEMNYEERNIHSRQMIFIAYVRKCASNRNFRKIIGFYRFHQKKSCKNRYFLIFPSLFGGFYNFVGH